VTRVRAVEPPIDRTLPAASATRATSRVTAIARKSGLNEREFQRQVTDLAVILGWDWAHFRPAQTAKGWRTPVSGTIGAGFVDLVLVRERDRRLIFAELKKDDGRLSGDQERVLDVLRSIEFDASCGEVPIAHNDDKRRRCCPPLVEVHVWRPRDLDAIAEILR
jgi:hypothetical protein